MFFGLFVGLVMGLIIGLGYGLIFGMYIALVSEVEVEPDAKIEPVESLTWSWEGLVDGLVGGLVVGLVFGLGATVQHYTLRFLLWHTHLFPWQAVPFLDDAVEQLLLRKVGGGYIFRHRLLQDYFASLEVIPPLDPSVRSETRSVVQNAPNSDPSG